MLAYDAFYFDNFSSETCSSRIYVFENSANCLVFMKNKEMKNGGSAKSLNLFKLDKMPDVSK